MITALVRSLTVAVLCSGFSTEPRASASGREVRLGVFGLFHPKQLTVSGESLELHCILDDGEVSCRSGADILRARRISAGTNGVITLTVPGKIKRTFQGSLEIFAANGALVPILTMPLEIAVAAAVAAESPPAAPLEALSAQAVVSRSYYLATRGRHALFDFCDTTHCQFLREPPPAGTPAAQAAAATSGLVLTWNGAVIPALFTASCGGHTRELPEPPEDAYPCFRVDCPYCRRTPPPHCSYCVRSTGKWGNRNGSGAGHGFGLCQTGAAGMASAGYGFRAILERYFPNTRLVAGTGY